MAIAPGCAPASSASPAAWTAEPTPAQLCGGVPGQVLIYWQDAWSPEELRASLPAYKFDAARAAAAEVERAAAARAAAAAGGAEEDAPAAAAGAGEVAAAPV